MLKDINDAKNKFLSFTVDEYTSLIHKNDINQSKCEKGDKFKILYETPKANQMTFYLFVDTITEHLEVPLVNMVLRPCYIIE